MLGLAAGTAWGALQRLPDRRLGFSPIIVTLGGLAGARGLAELITQGFTMFGFGRRFSCSATAAGYRSRAGLDLRAAFSVGAACLVPDPIRPAHGRNRRRARCRARARHPHRELPFWLYVCSGLASAVGGLIVTSELDGAAVTIGTGTELDVLTGILLGGVAVHRRRGSLFGVLFGAMFIGVLSNGLIQINVSPYFAAFSVGVALVFAAGLDVLYQRPSTASDRRGGRRAAGRHRCGRGRGRAR